MNTNFIDNKTLKGKLKNTVQPNNTLYKQNKTHQWVPIMYWIKSELFNRASKVLHILSSINCPSLLSHLCPNLPFCSYFITSQLMPNCVCVLSQPILFTLLSSACTLSSAKSTLSRFSPVQFSCSVASDSLRPLELQHARLPCSSPAPGVYSNSCP